MVSGWQCIRIGSAAIARIVHVAPWMIAAYLAIHPIPTDCATACHFVIPRDEFRHGGMFAPGRERPAPPAPKPAGDDWSSAGFAGPLLFPSAAPVFLASAGGEPPATGGALVPPLLPPPPAGPGGGIPPAPPASRAIAPVGEPRSAALLLAALAGLALLRRRHQ